MKLWILLAIAGVLLLWSFVRERFDATPSIKAPPYDAAEKRRLFDMVRQRSASPPYTFLGYQDILMNKAKAQLPAEAATAASTTATAEQKRTAEDKLKEAAGGLVSPAVEGFFTTVFRPATTPITKAQIDSFVDARVTDIGMVEKELLTTYFIGQSGVGRSQSGGANSYAARLAAVGQNTGFLTNNNPPGTPPATAGPAGTAAAAAASVAASMNPRGVASRSSSSASPVTPATEGDTWQEGPTPVCPAGTLLREDNKCVSEFPVEYQCPDGYEMSDNSMCQRIGGTDTIGPSCPAGFVFNNDIGQCDSTPVDPTCPGGFTYRDNRCMRRVASPSTPATTTGGTSASSYGPTSGGSGGSAGRLRQVFGPQFTERGNNVEDTGGDSSQTNVYPELLGGIMDTSTRIPGAGVVPPSKNFTLANNGSLPTTSSMGLDEMARYFPFSRTPGDMDVVPDPYRVAQTFSQSSYSSKTEPTPFLTDFSAFLK